MLLSFRFSNHRSFLTEQQLNLLPVYDADHPESDPATEPVPVVGVFGPNASGKSNLINALSYMCDFVGRSDREAEPGLGLSRLAIKRHPFRLDPARAEEPSSYVVDLLLQGVRYTYGFIVDDDGVVEEWLFSYPKKKRRTVFTRQGNAFTFGEESSSSKVTELADIVPPTALFLSVAARFGRTDSRTGRDATDETYGVMHGVYSWIYLGLARASGGRSARLAAVATRWFREPRRRAIITDLLRAADVGLRDIELRPATADEDFFSSLAEDSEAARERRDWEMTRTAGRGPELQFLHFGAAENVFLDVNDESAGTVRLLELASRAVTTMDLGGLFLVDEIDASLHPLLTAQLIGLFHATSVNRRGAQLVFSSHDPTLLGILDGVEVLRRDEVWFVEKSDEGVSTLYPLAEFKPRRQGENRVRRYLNGSYGAIPELSMELFERALTSRDDDNGA